jgi:hypothetical protein
MTVGRENHGALLYQHKVYRKLNILMGFVFATLLLAVAAFGFYVLLGSSSKFDDSWPFERFFALTVPVAFVWLAMMFVTFPFKSMPFRIYQRGVTMTRVPFRYGLPKRERFVPAREISRVTWEKKYVYKVGEVEHFRFHRRDGERSSDGPAETGPRVRCGGTGG